MRTIWYLHYLQKKSFVENKSVDFCIQHLSEAMKGIIDSIHHKL
jgi:hypothetical protein